MKNSNENDSQYSLKFLIDFNSLFQNFRGNVTTSYNDFVNRVKKELINSDFFDESQIVFNLNFEAEEVEQITKKKSFLFGFIQLFPSLLRQYTLLNKIKKSDEKDATILAITGNRILRNYLGGNLRDYFKYITTGFLASTNQNKISNKISETDYLVIVDTAFISSLRNASEESIDDQLLIIDQAFIYFLCLFSPFSLFKTAIQTAYNLIFGKEKEFLEKIFPIGVMYNQIYNELFERFHETVTVFYTGNSYSVEILLFNLINSNTCTEVYEIMHGIPSIHVQKYFSGLAELNNKYSNPQKLKYITQIPTIQEYILNGFNDNVDKDLSINTYYNSYLYKNKLRSEGSVNSYLHEKFSNCFNKLTDQVDSLFILFYIGAGTVTSKEDFTKSDVFQTEVLMLNLIKNSLKKLGVDYTILYSPHPDTNENRLLKLKIFNSDDIIFYNDTLFSTLVADACVGFLSSALFEASYLTVPTFTPMTELDNLYPGNLLQFLYSSQKNRDGMKLEQEMYNFLKNNQLENTSKVKRAKERVKLLMNEEFVQKLESPNTI